MLSASLLLAAAVVTSDPPIKDMPPRASERAHSHTHAKPEIDETQGPVLAEINYTSEVMANAAGGVRRGARYLDNLDLVVEVDLNRIAGWQGAELHVYGLYNNGASISDRVGDSQGVSNIETGTRAFRLYEAWIDQKISPHFSIRAGLYDLNSEFDALEASGLFVGSEHGIGTDIGQTGRNGPSIFPATSLAARVEVKPGAGWVLRTAVLDGVPGDPDHPGRTEIRLGSGDGALLIAEAEAPAGKGRLLLGHWRYTASFETHGGPRARGNAGVYLRGEAPLFDRGRRIDGFFRLGTASGRFNMFDRFASAGVKFSGWIGGRAQDEFGLALASAFTSRSYRRVTGLGASEMTIEATYRAPVTNGLTLQPSLHYIRNPSADRTIRDALVIGLRAELSFRILD